MFDSEIASALARIEAGLPTGAAFDFVGGVMLTREFGLGASLAGTAHQWPADLYLRIPAPDLCERLRRRQRAD
jgi:hypothetical protein